MTNVRCHEVRQPAVLAPQAGGGVLQTLRRLPAAVFHALLVWQARASERTHLASLDDRALRDMGLSRADVDAEVRKPFWRP